MVILAEPGLEVHPVKRYGHIFFDLDHTLWDFEGNSRAVLRELHAEFHLWDRSIPVDGFIVAYEQVNGALWSAIEGGSMDRDTLRALRFRQALAALGVTDNAMAARLEEAYMERCPLRTGLMPGAMRLLEDLRHHHRLHVITNGFTATQLTKITASGLRPFFSVVLTSEQAGASKPSVRIFRHALRSAGAVAGNSLMVGDSAKADMAGARAVGMDQAHLGRTGMHDPEATYRITSLDELRAVLLQG